MKFFTIITGGIFAFVGVFALVNSGLSFMSIAFPIGIVLLFVGLIQCLSYRSSRGDAESVHWMLIEGLTTFFLGVVVLSGRLAADIAVPVVFGMWVMISGIRGLVVISENFLGQEKNFDFFWTLGVGILNFGAGLYTFFNTDLLGFSVGTLVGVCIILQGLNMVKIGTAMTYKKPDLIKTKIEKLEEVTEQAALAHANVKEAIKAAKEAKKEVKKAEEYLEFHEKIEEPIEE